MGSPFSVTVVVDIKTPDQKVGAEAVGERGTQIWMRFMRITSMTRQNIQSS
jgi:hypothetical protein